jgi:hypothetical protein
MPCKPIALDKIIGEVEMVGNMMGVQVRVTTGWLGTVRES